MPIALPVANGKLHRWPALAAPRQPKFSRTISAHPRSARNRLWLAPHLQCPIALELSGV